MFHERPFDSKIWLVMGIQHRLGQIRIGLWAAFPLETRPSGQTW